MSNLEIIEKEFNELKGQLVLVDFKVYRFIGVVSDEWDYYNCLYDGEKLVLYSALIRLTPLKKYIPKTDYNEMITVCKLNHNDYIYGDNDEEKFNYYYKTELSKLGECDFISEPKWELV